MAWVWLLAAGICEVVWAAGLKRYGFTCRSVGGVMTILIMVLSFVLLSRAMRTLPLGTSYGVWVGIGAAGTVLYGILFLKESADVRRLICAAMIVAGVVGLKLLSKEEPATPPGTAPEESTHPL